MGEQGKATESSVTTIEGKFADELLTVFNLLRGESASPRVSAIVVAAYIENYLTDLIREKMPGLNPSLTKSIFNDKSGPLGTIGNKIDMAEALKALTKGLAADARLIARIRNRFAHEIAVDSFDHVRVRDLVDQLKTGSEGVKHIAEDGSEHPIDAGWTRAHRFNVAALGTCAMIMHGHIKEYPFSYEQRAADRDPSAPSREISVTQVQNPKSAHGSKDR